MSGLIRCLGVRCLVLLSARFALALANPQAEPASALLLKGEVSAADVSRDGRSLVFINWSKGELFVRDLTNGTDRQITHKRGSDTGNANGNAFISRDSQMLAYNWAKPDALELRLIPFSGGEPRMIDPGRALCPGSRDGLRIAGHYLLCAHVASRRMENLVS